MTSESDLQRRAADIRAQIGEHHLGPFKEAFAAIICANCGKTEQATSVEELEEIIRRRGWAISNGVPSVPDLCPRCVSALNAMQARAEAREAFARLGATLRRFTRR